MTTENTAKHSPDTQVEATADEPAADAEPATAAADEKRTPVDVTHAPPRTSQVITVVAALFGALLTAPFATLAIPFGIAGFVIVAAGLVHTHSRAWLSVGTGLILLGAIVTGAYGAVPPEQMLVGIGATIIGWDVGQHGLLVGDQLGRETQSRRNQLVHAAISAVAVGFVSTVAYVGYLFAGGGRHAAAVAVVVLGVVVVAWVFRS